MRKSNHYFMDTHCHTILSDGKYSPEEVIRKAINANITALALTDHNIIADNLSELQLSYPEILLIPGCEITCKWITKSQKEVELHIIGLFVKRSDPLLNAIFSKNQNSRDEYLNNILSKLKKYNIDIGSLESLKKKYPNTKYLGRMHIAEAMLLQGFVNNIDEAFDEYIGAFGKRRAYVKNTTNVAVTLEDTVKAIRHAKGIAVLPHLFYFQLDDEEIVELLQYFKELAGEIAGLATEYALYSCKEREQLYKFSQEYCLLPTCASDFHGMNPSETLNNHFPIHNFYKLCKARMEAYGEFVNPYNNM